jgi:predicted DCC family thiol-disulfide oxidoreductase YuxK
MMTSNFTFIYDGECPFCNHFAELLEIKSKINNLKILDGRKNLSIIRSLLEKGYDLDKGAILLKDDDIFHGANAINVICKEVNNPSSNLLKILSSVFKSNKRTKLLFPFLLRARRFALISKGVSRSLV